ncbi:MAG: roadblock/LC7 domain-containing protein [Candidatus Undinarchaeales archaeon]|jgi:hypothetical protein|nr:roadblock/LC7 domain-containing protein [Candidatus Undinarchaeales archaeon]MDP7493178.1 roadblock/LC7 domain-containing protein [Candidatus Undinarchaeales archaeon]
MATVKKMLEKVLDGLRSVGDIEASAIVSRDGLLMASDMATGINAETFAAMSATMLGAAETAATELGRGLPDRIIVESEETKLIAIGTGPKALLVVMTSPEAGLGLVLIELEKAADKIKMILE